MREGYCFPLTIVEIRQRYVVKVKNKKSEVVRAGYHQETNISLLTWRENLLVIIKARAQNVLKGRSTVRAFCSR